MRLSFCLVFVVVALSSSLADDTTIAPPTTPIPTTTVPTPTTPTTKSTTTTTTTTAKSTTPTTAVPTVPTTTAKPDVLPWPKNLGHWFVNDTKTNISCLVIDAAFQVTVTYENVDNKTVTGTIDIPKTASGDGTCSDDTADLQISWPVSNVSNDTNSLELVFQRDSNGPGKDGVFGLSQINLTVTPVFSDAKENRTMNIVAKFKETRFRTPLNKSYTCMKEPLIPVGNTTTFVVGLKVGKLQVEAFRSTVFDKFSPEFECSADDVSAVVPFAVGASLALLVVIVLIAYLIGRRRSRARGYQSV